MSCIQKKRYGELEPVREGRQYCWKIRDFLNHISTKQNGAVSEGNVNRYVVLDSPKKKSFEGVMFHLRVVIDDGHLGFYIHYKNNAIPKYSFAFESVASGSNNGQSEHRTKLCQSTANSIPSKSSRCGHRNVITISDLLNKFSAPNRTLPDQNNLYIDFCFDEDYVEDQSTGTYVWHIRNISKIHSSELYSSILVTNFGKNAASVFFMICLDHRVDFRIAHKDQIPQFGFSFMSTKNDVIFRSSTSVEPPLKDIVLRSIAHDDTLLVRVAFFINPLNQISTNAGAGMGRSYSASSTPVIPPPVADSSGSANDLVLSESLTTSGNTGAFTQLQQRNPRRDSSQSIPDPQSEELQQQRGAEQGGYVHRLMPANLIDASICHMQGVPDLEPLEGPPELSGPAQLARNPPKSENRVVHS